MKKALFWMAAVAASGILARKAYQSRRVSRHVKGILPDNAGNYDIDGVSYDKRERAVTVSGDATQGDPQPRFTH